MNTGTIHLNMRMTRVPLRYLLLHEGWTNCVWYIRKCAHAPPQKFTYVHHPWVHVWGELWCIQHFFLDSTYFVYAFLALNCTYLYSWQLAFVLKLVETHTTYNTNWFDANFHETLQVCWIVIRFAWIAFHWYCRIYVKRNIVMFLVF